jgi:hypothetical protein
MMADRDWWNLDAGAHYRELGDYPAAKGTAPNVSN